MLNVPVDPNDIEAADQTETANGTEATPAAPASPTSSSDLSLRHTTPVLDSPVSLPAYGIPRESSDKATSGVIEYWMPPVTCRADTTHRDREPPR